MSRRFVWRAGPIARVGVLLFGLALALHTAAQAQMTITGTVMDEAGAPVENGQVLIQSLQLATTTGEDGTYQLFVPAARMAGQTSVQLTARRIGLRAQTVTVALVAGGALTQNFSLAADPFLLEAVIVTGQGMREERAKLATTISSIRAEDIGESKAEVNLVAAMAGKAPNVEVTSSTGDPGGGAYIRIRGSKTIEGGTQPLIIVDGVAITNASNYIEFSGAGTLVQNRLADINPDDIESIEILKGAAAAGLYGSRATNGVVMITTKSGQRNQTQVTLRTSLGVDKINRVPNLQTRWQQGAVDPAGDPADQSNGASSTTSLSWGPLILAGDPVYDHANEMFGTGMRSDNSLSLAGGTDRTTYFLSVGYLYHDGTIEGNSKYKRLTTRLKGAHDFLDNLNVEGNFSFTSSDGDLVQTGSNTSGMLLGAFRTPPNFNNLPWIDSASGLHRSYRHQTPTALAVGRGYDNPFWVANEVPNTASVDRYMGNIQLDWDPFSWWDVRYLVGLDFANDQRVTLFPKSSSNAPNGRIIRADLTNTVFDQTILMSFQDTPSETFGWSLTLGHNMNQTQFRRYQVQGDQVIFGTGQLDFAIDKDPDEYEARVRTEGLFADLALDLWGQLYLKGGVRYDGSNTFGGDTSATGEQESSRFWYPKASLAWDFSRYIPGIDFAKLRGAYGQAGIQPPIYSNTTGFFSPLIADGWIDNGLNTIYQGNEGVVFSGDMANTDIIPERTTEFEAGMDLAFLNNSLNLGVTYYKAKTKSAIVNLPIAPSSGFNGIDENGATWRNWGWEVTLDWLPVQKRDFSWRLAVNWATNNSNVDSLLGAEEIVLNGFASGRSSVVQGHQFPILYGSDWVRFGRGELVGGVDIDATYSGWSEGDLYIDVGGLPIESAQERVIGDPNPDWLGNLRTTFTFFGKLRLSGLLDIKHGGETWNGTKGALYYFGAHGDTDPIHGNGVQDSVFAGFGPGAGTAVDLDWTDYAIGPFSGFTGPSAQFIEESNFVKIRDVSLAYTWEAPWLSSIGFNALDVTVSGRNLVTWTNYTGLDPETNLTGQTTGRGLEYFNHPQTRTFVFTLTFRR